MAKSIRSKRKRKLRAIKRERYGQKELTRLKKILGVDEGDLPSTATSADVVMSSVSEIATVRNPKELLKHEEDEEQEAAEDIVMEVDGKKRIFNSKTKLDQNGTPPVWMSQRRLRKNKNKGKPSRFKNRNQNKKKKSSKKK